jgi:chromosome segregation and condensation protein ScpB
MCRTTDPFMRLFGLSSLDELPDVARWIHPSSPKRSRVSGEFELGEARAAG